MDVQPHKLGAAVTTVVFDLGTTLLDETEMWGAIADEIGVPRSTFLTTLDEVIAGGEDHRRVFELFGVGPRFPTNLAYRDEMLYPDAKPCLDRLRGLGFRVGIAANQPARAEEYMQTLGELCVVGSSATWGCSKPAPEFFERLQREVGASPGEIVYVGDRVDNDIEPALAAGMVAVHLKRGQWAELGPPTPEQAIRIDSLDQLPQAWGHA